MEMNPFGRLDFKIIRQHLSYQRWSLCLSDQMSYTVVYNALNFPAGVVPVTKVTTEDLQKLEDEYPTDNMYHQMIKAVISLSFSSNIVHS